MTEYLPKGPFTEAYVIGGAPFGEVDLEHQEAEPLAEDLIETSEATDPHEAALEAVDSFLDLIAEDIELSAEAWKGVKGAQARASAARESKELTQNRMENIRMLPGPKDPTRIVHGSEPSSRRVRRISEREMGVHLSMLFSGAQGDSEKAITDNISVLFTGETDEEQRASTSQKVDEICITFEKNMEMLRERVPDSAIDAINDLHRAYATAHAADYRVLGRLNQFLGGGGEVAMVFLDRLKELADLASRGAVEYPGLLETLAANHAKFDKDGFLSKLITRVVGHPDDFAAEFLAKQTTGEVKSVNRREVAVAMAVMKLSESIIGDVPGLDIKDYEAAFAERWRSWPEPLREALEKYTNDNVTSYRQSISNALKPFVRQGRLPGVGREMSFDIKNQQARTVSGKKGTHKKSKGRDNMTLSVATKSQDMQDVLSSKEEDPISRIAYLVNTGQTARQNIFRVEELENIEDIMKVKHIENYLKKHPENGFADTVRAALERLMEDPFDTTSTRPWQGVRYRLEESRHQPRRLRRFSLQDFPGVGKDSIASKTRIVYSVFQHENEPTLAIYGIFLKQDIETVPALPRRR